MTSEEPQVFELSSNVSLRPLPDPDDEESIQVWETLTGNVDHPLDSDSFWLTLEEDESVAVFVESVSHRHPSRRGTPRVAGDICL